MQELSSLPRFPPELQKIADDACIFVRDNKKLIIDRFAGDGFPSVDQPTSFFMAGSPGAGKTELSKSLIKVLQEKKNSGPIVRIDGDEIRAMLPGYDGSNSYLFQRAISIGVDKLHDHVLHKKKSFILDGTFSKLDKARENVNRSIKEHRPIVIIYVYQDPIISWEFTKKREVKEGRSIPKNIFIEQFFAAKQVVQTIKDEFDSQVEIWLVERNLKSENPVNIEFNIAEIDSHIIFPYSEEVLKSTII